MFCNFADVLAPRGYLLISNFRFGYVVNDKELVGKLGYQFRCSRELACINQNVVGKTEMAQPGNTADECFAEQEAVVGFSLHNMTNSAKLSAISVDLQ